MTTKVIIKHGGPDTEAISVQALPAIETEPVVEPVVLAPGESEEFYVHSSQMLAIHETSLPVTGAEGGDDGPDAETPEGGENTPASGEGGKDNEQAETPPETEKPSA